MFSKEDVRVYFDRAAETWDKRMVRNDQVIGDILDAAGIFEGCRVLDVACGTGVLIPDYLARGAWMVTGVDLSPQMIRIARDKFPDDRVELLCADVEELDVAGIYDSVVVYNAFPHFPDPEHLIERLAGYLRPGGRLCIAHGMSRQALLAHHAGPAHNVSQSLPETSELVDMMEPWVHADVQISDEKKVIVAGRRPTQ